MLTAASDPLFAHCVVERASIAHHLLDGFSITPAAQRIVGIVIEGNIENWTKIEVETKNAQQTSGDIAMAADQIHVVLVAQLLRIRRLAADQAQSRDSAAFLVDRDDWL